MSTGFFGKLPLSGDFVARGLGPGVRPVIDRWMTSVLGPYRTEFSRWPVAGLRGVLRGPEGPLALLIVPSEDAAERLFPLAMIAPADGAGRAGIDAWADAVLPYVDRAVSGTMSAGDLAQAVADQTVPATGPDVFAPQLWCAGINPAEPARMLATRFG